MARDEVMWRRARERALKDIAETSAEEDAQTVAAALADPDNPPLTDAQLSRMRPTIEVHPELVARLEAARKARETEGRIMTSLALDVDVLAHYRALGADWDRRINEILRKAANLPEPSPRSPVLTEG